MFINNHFQSCTLSGKEVIVDEWPKWSSLIVRTSDTADKVGPSKMYKEMEQQLIVESNNSS